MIPYSDTNSRVAKKRPVIDQVFESLRDDRFSRGAEYVLSEASLLKYCWMRSWLLVQSIMVLRDDAVTLRS